MIPFDTVAGTCSNEGQLKESTERASYSTMGHLAPHWHRLKLQTGAID